MSLLYRRAGSPFWYVAKTRESTKTTNRKLAEEYARKALTEHWRRTALGEERHTWKELAEAWLDAKTHKRSLDRDRFIIADATDFLRRRDLDTADLADLSAEHMRAYGAFVKARASAPTANRHLALLRAMLKRAEAYEWIPKCPLVEMYELPKREAQWLTPAQLDAILAHLPPWVAAMTEFAAQTGLRYSNVAGLRWDWLSADGRTVIVPAIAAKTARTHTVPLSAKALKILEGRREIGPLSPDGFVFSKPDGAAPVPSIRFWWEQAREKAGLPEIKFHEATRHTWASWHTQNQTPDRILQEMGGWASPAMLQRYAHLTTEHLSEYADNLNAK